MKYLIKIFVLFTLINVLTGCVDSRQNNISPKRILFVGNSLTYYNDIPAMVAKIYSVIGKPQVVEAEMLAQAGYSIEQHLSNEILNSTLTDSKYDFVVLQDFGGWPLCSISFDACASSSDPLSEAIKLVKSSGAIPIWFSTYHANPDYQLMLSKESRIIALSLDVGIADVGAAMLAFSSTNSEYNIILPNNHPNTLGSWIAASTIVRSIINKPLRKTMTLDSICRLVWQNTNLSAKKLASKQQPTTKECNQLPSNLFDKVVTAANNSFIDIEQ
jgi:hypothetical protein